MLPNQLQPRHFISDVDQSTATCKTVAGWIYHFFGAMPDETIDEVLASATAMGTEPEGELLTDAHFTGMTPTQLHNVWTAGVLPAMSAPA